MTLENAPIFFDCNVSFGVPPIPPLSQATTAEALLAEMDHCGIDEALVTCVAQRFESPLVGNELLIERVRDHPRLHPAWAILPPQTGEMPGPDQLVEQMRTNGVRALWAWPSQHKYLLDETTFGPLFEELVVRRIPLFFQLTDGGDTRAGWSKASALLREFPDLTLVAADQSVWGEDHYFRPLIERYPNFHVETSHYELANGLRDFCRCYGADRLLFGTAYPKRYMGGAVLQLLHADVPQSAVQAIAGGNLLRLLQEVKL
jgi:predicted TIM-barrel fold metal-dependent hydrolase